MHGLVLVLDPARFLLPLVAPVLRLLTGAITGPIKATSGLQLAVASVASRSTVYAY
jgi:hypothetical protein